MAELTMQIDKKVVIHATAMQTWEAILDQIGPGQVLPDGIPMPMVLEAWPGGRWFRDLGSDAGHFWGHVQVIKPGKVLEIHGPMFMSYAAVSHIQYRLDEKENQTTLSFTHRALGDILPDHRTGVNKGWDHFMKRIAERATK